MTSQTEPSKQADAERNGEAKPEASKPTGYEGHDQWQAALSVMHPDTYDPDWRHYHGAWGG